MKINLSKTDILLLIVIIILIISMILSSENNCATNFFGFTIKQLCCVN
jgi:hypothetical protein